MVLKKNFCVFLWIVWCVVLVCLGCGRKGPPIVPVVPQPLPVQNVSASFGDHAVTLSWTPPSEYNTGKPLKLEDIRTIKVFRRTEIPADNRWDFSRNSEGWKVAGKTFPIKWHKGVLRTGSEQKSAFIVSPKNLSIKAENTRYVRLKLWSKNSDRGYIAFITDKDSNWDTAVDLTFQPAVHTSFYSYQNAFNPVKLKSFQISPLNGDIKENIAHEYIIDMKGVPSWKGQITQIGVILRKSDPEFAAIDLGLDSFEFTNTFEERASIYTSSPWLFLEDEEGWRSNRPDTLFGSAEGVLYAREAESLALMSAPGQNIRLEDIRQIQIRMKVTNGDNAFLVLRRSQHEQFQPSASAVTPLLPYRFQFPLKGNTEFHTYSIHLNEILIEKDMLSRLKKGESLSQIGILFPALAGNINRDILIDYVHIFDATVAPELLLPFLVQESIPPIPEIAAQVQQKMSLTDPEFGVSYDDLLSQREQADNKPIKLVDVSLDNPAPIILQDGKFFLTDTGEFSASGSKDTTLNYGERYTYTIEFTDRKKQQSVQPGSLTVDFTRIPTAPYSLTAEPGDGEVHLMWNRPFLTVDGKKIRSFAGYNIFRALEPGQAPNTLIYRASPNETMFTDKNLSNGLTYYYTVQSIAPTTSGSYIGDFSQEVSARPADTIPPDVPAGLVGVYTGNAVDMFWNLIETEDFAGFNVYRSEERLGEFLRINSQPILQASYQDTTAEAYKTYYYYVTSFDSAVPPNESQPSEIAVVETSTVE